MRIRDFRFAPILIITNSWLTRPPLVRTFYSRNNFNIVFMIFLRSVPSSNACLIYYFMYSLYLKSWDVDMMCCLIQTYSLISGWFIPAILNGIHNLTSSVLFVSTGFCSLASFSAYLTVNHLATY